MVTPISLDSEQIEDLLAEGTLVLTDMETEEEDNNGASNIN